MTNVLHDSAVYLLADWVGAAGWPSSVQWFVAGWTFFLGGCFGSFMNVVIYRVPAGLSVVHPASHCPQCNHDIRWYDNIPVLTWFILRGRCRDCGQPYSFRYPAVEALVGAVFLALALVQCYSDGANLPLRATPVANVWYITGFHLLLFCTLICAAMIEFDRNAVPVKLFVPIFVIGVAAPMWMPELHPVAAFSNVGPWVGPATWLVGLADGLSGIFAGLLLGMACWPATSARPGDGKAAAVAAGVCGLLLGWQAVAAITLAAGVIFLVTRLLSWGVPAAGRVPWIGCLAAMAYGYLLNWQSIVERLPAIGPDASPVILLVAAVMLNLFSFLSRWAIRGNHIEEKKS